jgi:hypothetical protein
MVTLRSVTGSVLVLIICVFCGKFFVSNSKYVSIVIKRTQYFNFCKKFFSSFCSSFRLFQIHFTATISCGELTTTRYTFPDPLLLITLFSVNPNKMADSVKFNCWNGVSSHVESSPSFLFL